MRNDADGMKDDAPSDNRIAAVPLAAGELPPVAQPAAESAAPVDQPMAECVPNAPPSVASVGCQADDPPTDERVRPAVAPVDELLLALSAPQDATGSPTSAYQAQNIVNGIYASAESGFAIAMFRLLQDLVDDHTRMAIVHQVSKESDGQELTPLAVASRNGHLKVVRILLGNFSVRLEQECRAKFDGHIVEGATALWCAAGAGHLDVVKLLIRHGANVNHRTKTLSTPLRAACFDGRLDIVAYLVAHGADVNVTNAYNNTCLMISAYKGHRDVVAFLLAHGAEPNGQAHCGATALHYAAECGYTDICERLLDAGARLQRNDNGMTPVITAAERTRELVLEMFFQRDGLLDKAGKLDALELLGASFANDKDNYNLDKALHYLTTAMAFRYEDPDNVIAKPHVPPVPAYENWIESQTVQDLAALRFNHNSIHMESLAIRERILTRKCPDVAHPVVYRGAVCADHGRFDRCEALWLHALELRQMNELSVQRDLLRFAQVFSQMIHVGAQSLRLRNVLTVMRACLAELRINQQKLRLPGPKDDVKVVAEEYESNIITALYLCAIVTKLLRPAANGEPSRVPKAERLTAYKLVHGLTQLDVRMRNGYTLLHLAVDGTTPVDDFHIVDVCRFPCIDTIRLLVLCGAPVNVFDAGRNSPLHVLTASLKIAAPTARTHMLAEDIAEVLIEAGVHLDAVNNEGLTAAEMWKVEIATESVRALIRRHESRHTTLLCLASRCIARHRIAFAHRVPVHLEEFVQLHTMGHGDNCD